jgi:hypothetical protein
MQLPPRSAHFVTAVVFAFTSLFSTTTPCHADDAAAIRPPGPEAAGTPQVYEEKTLQDTPDLQELQAGKWRVARAYADADVAAAREIKPIHSWESGEGKSYAIPAIEVTAFLGLLNLFDRFAFPEKRKDGKKTYDTSLSTFWDHLRDQNWTYDKDRFDVNQFGHPYEGATMFGLARSAGVGFWPSVAYANVGSFLWEMGGETSRPSINDIITTGNAGSLLGEALFRTASLVLEEGGAKPALWRELVAATLLPPNSFNRYAFGDRFKSVFPSHNPAHLWRLDAGTSLETHMSDRNEVSSEHQADAIAAFSIEYGIPGKGDYTYRRPFDYFNFGIATRARAEHVLQALNVRGLLIGTDYQAGDDYRGIWGLYGTYDYLAPYLYRASSTALSLGTTGNYRVASGVALHGTLLCGFGFGAAGADKVTVEGRGYHYGATPQGLLSLNMLLGDRAMVDLSSRAYYVSNIGSDHPRRGDVIVQTGAAVTMRITGRHAVGVQYLEWLRGTHYNDQPHRTFSEGTVSLFYTYLSEPGFGAVDWH